MTVWLTAMVVIAATSVWLWLVPRVTVDEVEAPDFASLVTPGSALAVAAAALTASGVLWLLPAWTWWLWVPYLAFGVPLITVDAATTYLPKQLHYPALGAMCVSSLGLALTSRQAWLSAAAAGFAALMFFFVWYRISGGLGFGDVRLALLVGAVAGQSGFVSALAALLLGTIVAALYGIGHTVWAARQEGRPRYFAYGPGLWAGPLVWVVLSAAAHG